MLHRLHRGSAVLIGLFVILHLANHTVSFSSVEAHIRTMEALRVIYRHPLAEVLLISCVLLQIGSGLTFLRRRKNQRKEFIDIAQALSGLYLAFFLLIHVSAVLVGRGVMGLDTNFWFAAAGLNMAPFYLFFIPYYFLAVLAFVTHLACAFYWLSRNDMSESRRKLIALSVMGAAAVFSALLVANFAGAFMELSVPAEYVKVFQLGSWL